MAGFVDKLYRMWNPPEDEYNEKIKAILSSLWNGLSMGHKVTEEDYAKISMYEHRKILDAIQANEVEKARKRMYDHIIRSMENILTRFSP